MIDVAALGRRGPKESFHWPPCGFPAGFQNGSQSRSQREQAASCGSLPLRHQQRSIAPTAPVDVLPANPVAFVRAKPSVIEHPGNVSQQRRSTGQVSSKFILANHPLPALLAPEHLHLRNSLEDSPLDSQSQATPQNTEFAVDRASF